MAALSLERTRSRLARATHMQSNIFILYMCRSLTQCSQQCVFIVTFLLFVSHVSPLFAMDLKRNCVFIYGHYGFCMWWIDEARVRRSPLAIDFDIFIDFYCIQFWINFSKKLPVNLLFHWRADGDFMSKNVKKITWSDVIDRHMIKFINQQSVYGRSEHRRKLFRKSICISLTFGQSTVSDVYIDFIRHKSRLESEKTDLK